MKKLISLLLSMAMVFSMTAVQALAADEETAMLADTGAEGTDAPVAQTVTLDLSKGSIVISATGYKQGGGNETPFTGAYTIKQSDKAYLTNTISVTGGTHEITMNDVVIDASGISGACAFSIATGATVDLKLAGRVMLKSGEYAAGLSVPAGATVTISAISASGALTAGGGEYSAGIGGSASGNVVYASGGNITILSGTVDARGGENAAGIGGASNGAGTGKGESICISGGKVTATGGSDGAGIGGGRSSYGAGTGQNGKITIEGNAIVTATGGSHGAGIGGGYGANGTGEGGKITLGGAANVTASSVYGAGIGSGETISDGVYGTGQSGEVLITENVTVKVSSRLGAGIGGGVPANYGSYGTGKDGRLTINGNADVTAISMCASGIGGGWSNNSYVNSHTTGTNGVISVSGNAVVNATGGAYGIGGYDNQDTNGSLNISGGTVTARATSTDSTYACGIGRIKKCNIYGGTVSASGYTGIYRANVNGGVVTAESSKSTNGFGALTSDGNWYGWVTSLPAQASNNGMKSGVLFSGNEGKIIGSSYTLPADREIPDGATLTVDAGQELIIPAGTTLTVNGKLVVAGTLNTAETDAIAGSGETEITGTVTGKKLPITIQAHDMSTMEKTFDVSTLFTIPQTAGAAAYTVTKDGTPVTLDGTTLSIPDGGVFTVTVATAETEYYQEASATATLTATVHNHQLRAVAAKAPDCLNAGNIAYWVCESGCGKYFRDESGENVITAAETVLPATGHHFDNGVCTACGAEDPAYEKSPVIEVGSCNAYPGDTITIPVSLRNNDGIASIMFTVSYDANCLEYQGASFTEALTGLSNTVAVNDETTGKVTMSWVKGASGEYTGSETIANLKFEVIAVSENTSAQVSLTYDKENVFNESLKNQNFLVKNGTVQIGKYRPGDINGDGTVDVNDALLLLLNYVCDLRKDEVKGNPDVNGDGAVNNKDVVILLRYIAKFEGITLY